jgi:hypothetical protein
MRHHDVGAAVESARQSLQIIDAYQQLGSHRAAAARCGTTRKTVRRVIERQRGLRSTTHEAPRGLAGAGSERTEEGPCRGRSSPPVGRAGQEMARAWVTSGNRQVGAVKSSTVLPACSRRAPSRWRP